MSWPAWHAGERAVQRRVGVEAQLAAVGPRVLRSFMPEQHREFFEHLPFVIAGTVDAAGQPWASVLAAPPGFITSPDPKALVFQAQPLPGDPLNETLADDAPIGLLGLEPHTRRRNRANGIVQHVTASGFSVQIEQSFGNCPKYIQARKPVYLHGNGGRHPDIHSSDFLDVEALRMISKADTLFIATAYPRGGEAAGAAGGVDVSHRGGKPGFVQVAADGTLTMPDFLGNYFFNTLGNIALNPTAGLLFIDFDNGDLLYLAASAEIVWEGAEVRAFEGAQRLLKFKVLAMRRVVASLPLRWGMPSLSPFLERMGH